MTDLPITRAGSCFEAVRMRRFCRFRLSLNSDSPNTITSSSSRSSVFKLFSMNAFTVVEMLADSVVSGITLWMIVCIS